VTGDFRRVAQADACPPGERIVVAYGRDDVVIFNVDGQYYAIKDECSHEDYPLSNGTLDGTTIECAKHGACFDITTGVHLSPPAFTGVRAYDVRVEGGAIWIARRA
jgi:3-phenylpropionate/trans-cinnamate dioxygenase ferredoxin subunit